jgi:hypothetical protein
VAVAAAVGVGPAVRVARAVAAAVPAVGVGPAVRAVDVAASVAVVGLAVRVGVVDPADRAVAVDREGWEVPEADVGSAPAVGVAQVVPVAVVGRAGPDPVAVAAAVPR